MILLLSSPHFCLRYLFKRRIELLIFTLWCIYPFSMSNPELGHLLMAEDLRFRSVKRSAITMICFSLDLQLCYLPRQTLKMNP